MLAPSKSDSPKRKLARKGLFIYFAILIPLSVLFEWLMIKGNLSWVYALMWTPAAASVAARLMLREGFQDVSFRVGGRTGVGAILLAWIFPILFGLIVYCTAWFTSLAPFTPRPNVLSSWLLGDSGSSLIIFLVNLLFASTIVTLYSIRTAAGEEIGWRGYMLTRLIDSGVPAPILTSGLIWGLWHVPLIFGGVYLTGIPPMISATLWMITAVSFSFIFAQLRLMSGSVWPAILLHAAWNSVIQSAFDPASPGAELWVGESGILVAVFMIISAFIFYRSKDNAKQK